MSRNHDPPGIIWQTQPRPYAALPANTWVEVTHCADSQAQDLEMQGVWFYYAKGSGIFFNTGKTISFQDHDDAVKYFLNKDCSGDLKKECTKYFSDLIKSASQSFDSIQFLNHADQRCGENLSVEIIGLNGSGSLPCGAGIELRKGWKASESCKCSTCINCNSA